MFLGTASPRRSFNIPININLQGARRRQTRDLLHTAVAAQEKDWMRAVEGRGGHRARSQVAGSSVGEERAVLLGCSMMAFSVLMFFMVGIIVVKPYVSRWEEEGGGCVLLHTHIADEWVDCRGVSSVPCLQAAVNLTASNQRALLHFDEESVLLSPQCFYLPKCQMERAELQEEVMKVKSSLDSQLGSPSSCFSDPAGHPGDVILSRKRTLRRTLLALLWPCLMLGGGALLVAMVRLTQGLARFSAKMCSGAAGAGGRPTPGSAQGKLYKLLRRASVPSPT